MFSESAPSFFAYSTCVGTFSVLAGVLLVIFSEMLARRSITFDILCAKHNWDCDVKSAACMRAAYAYFIVSAACLLIALFMTRVCTNTQRKRAKEALQHITAKSDLEAQSLSAFDGISQFH